MREDRKKEKEGTNERKVKVEKKVGENKYREFGLVSWCFEPCQPQTITLGLGYREERKQKAIIK